MPRKVIHYACGLCGATFEEEGHAKTCEEAHIRPEDIVITAPASIPGYHQAGVYAPAEPWPEALVVRGSDVAGPTATYQIMRAKGSSGAGVGYIPTNTSAKDGTSKGVELISPGD